MDGAYNIWGRGEVHTMFQWGNMRGRDHLREPGINGSVVLKLSSRKGFGCMDWIDLAQDWV